MSAFPTNEITRSDYTPRLLAQQVLRTAGDTVYSTAPRKAAQVSSVLFCNGTGSAATVRLHHIRPSDSAALRNALIYDASIPAATTLIFEAQLNLNAGDTLFASSATATAVAISVYGEETTV